MKKKQIKKVDLTLMARFNRMVGKGIFATEVIFDALALGARAVRDALYTFASRSAKLADAEGDMSQTFDRVDDYIDSALGR